MSDALAALAAHDASMPDFETEWREIEQEERRVREELNNALPGDPILGPPSPPSSAPAMLELPFEVITTRYGTVYHTQRDCRYLTAPVTGQAMIHKWCSRCRNDAAQTGRIPGRGATMLMTGWRSDAHTDVTCERAEGARSFALCTACLDGT